MKSYLVHCQNENIKDDEESAEDVGVTFDGFRIGLSFEDGGKYNIIFDELLSALNADGVRCEEAAIEELEKLLKTAKGQDKDSLDDQKRHVTLEESPVKPRPRLDIKPLPDVKPQGIDPAGHRKPGRR